MLATIRDAVREYATNVGYQKPLVQWILSDYDTWEPNPFYIGPDQGHPEDPDVKCTVWETFKEAAEEGRRAAMHYGTETSLENYNGRCWVVWY